MSRKSKALPVFVENEETRVENFGKFLYETFTKTVHPSVFDLQLRHYSDYLHHFGFSVEKESMQQGLSHLPGAATMQAHGHVPTQQQEAAAAEEEIIACAGWGISDAERNEADARAQAVGPLEGVTKPEEVAARLLEPFQKVTWRQSATQCAVKKARVLYSWLCENVSIELPAQNSAVRVEAATNAEATKNDSRQRGGGAAARSMRRKAGVVTQPVTASVVVVNPLEMALQRRIADPHTMACLFQKCLQYANLQSMVVEGYIRGRAPEESIQWTWNIVCIQQENQIVQQYLVDVALSSYRGPLHPIMHPNDTATTAVIDTGRAKLATPVGASPSKPKRPASVHDEIKPKRGILEAPTLAPANHVGRRVEDFYFFTHPQQFFSTHFPNEGRCTLLVLPPRKTAWESAPCLTHNFFRFPLSLVSHRRRCNFTARTTPFYVTFLNEKPENIELCCFIFKGPLKKLPEDCSTATPLGPQWVWHQREESRGRETFTVMVPEAGYYSVIIGAREIRSDPFSAVISTDSFVPVVAYQVLVTFVLHQVPHLPRQRFSPSVCKLIEPLVFQVLEGVVRFVVMPSCANVAGVAVVSRRPSDDSREFLAFLPFLLQLVAYADDVMLIGGSEVEVWILYAAPDHNYVNISGLPRVTPCLTSRAPVSSFGVDSSRTAGQQVEASPRLASQDGLLFLPFVMGIEVTKLAGSAAAASYIQPQPSMEGELRPTLRRLIGVTPELYREATGVVDKKVPSVGSYFAAKNSL